MEDRFQMVTWRTYVGATGRRFVATLTDEDGAAYNLTGFTATISVASGSTYVVASRALVIDNAAGGVLGCYFEASHLATAGLYTAQIRLVSGGLVDYTEPFGFLIETPKHSA